MLTFHDTDPFVRLFSWSSKQVLIQRNHPISHHFCNSFKLVKNTEPCHRDTVVVYLAFRKVQKVLGQKHKIVYNSTRNQFQTACFAITIGR